MDRWTNLVLQTPASPWTSTAAGRPSAEAERVSSKRRCFKTRPERAGRMARMATRIASGMAAAGIATLMSMTPAQARASTPKAAAALAPAAPTRRLVPAGRGLRDTLAEDRTRRSRRRRFGRRGGRDRQLSQPPTAPPGAPGIAPHRQSDTALPRPFGRGRAVPPPVVSPPVVSPSAVYGSLRSAGQLQGDRHRLEGKQRVDVGTDPLAGRADGIHASQELLG